MTRAYTAQTRLQVTGQATRMNNRQTDTVNARYVSDPHQSVANDYSTE